MAATLKHTGEIPALQKPVIEICRDVFELLTSDEATINDLSLPARDNLTRDFALTMSSIHFNFYLVSNENCIPESYTTPCFNDEDFLFLVLCNNRSSTGV